MEWLNFLEISLRVDLEKEACRMNSEKKGSPSHCFHRPKMNSIDLKKNWRWENSHQLKHNWIKEEKLNKENIEKGKLKVICWSSNPSLVLWWTILNQEQHMKIKWNSHHRQVIIKQVQLWKFNVWFLLNFQRPFWHPRERASKDN